MADEEKKVTFKEKFKKALPWIVATAGTIGGCYVGYKLGKAITKTREEIEDEIVISDYLVNAVNNAKNGDESCVAVMDGTGKVTYAAIKIIDKPDWFEDGEVETETIVTNVVETVNKPE